MEEKKLETSSELDENTNSLEICVPAVASGKAGGRKGDGGIAMKRISVRKGAFVIRRMGVSMSIFA